MQKPALTLFSVNSFLYGFYISPIISYQRNRIDMLHKLVGIECSKLYEIALYSKRLEADWHKKVLKALQAYTSSAYSHSSAQGEKQYEEFMSLLVSYDGEKKDPFKEMMKASFAVQQNRAEIFNLLGKKVFKNEWIVMSILFTVTLSFILLIEVPGGLFFAAIPPILCAGLSMLIIILAKMSTLTHKRATTIWDPLNSLNESHFYKLNN